MKKSIFVLFLMVNFFVLVSCPQKSNPNGNNQNTPQIVVGQKTYTVTFNSNGGNGGTISQTFIQGEEQKLLKNIFTYYENYIFDGWSTSPAGLKVYDDEEAIIVTSDLVLYARWIWVYHPSSIKLSEKNLCGEKGETFQLEATIIPDYTTNKNVKWSTGDSSIAEVDSSGFVTIKSDIIWAETTITVTTEDGGYTASCTVTVIKRPTISAGRKTDFVKIDSCSMRLGMDGSFRVNLTRPFEICNHEVTQKEWYDLLRRVSFSDIPSSVNLSSPSHFDKDPTNGEIQENRPVESISWYYAIAYCNYKTRKEEIPLPGGNYLDYDYVYFSDSKFKNAYRFGDAYEQRPVYIKLDSNGKIAAKGYRLPTEAEWEIAARGGLVGDCWAGTCEKSQLESYAWFSNNANKMTHEVMKKLPNGYGLYDMTGNVSEFVYDNICTYDSEVQTDPVGTAGGRDSITRGGDYRSEDSKLYISERDKGPSYGYRDTGFRLVRSW